TPFRAHAAEAVLQGQEVSRELIVRAAVQAAAEARPRSRAAYRRSMVEVLTRRALEEVLGMAPASEKEVPA
ncbi:MAG: hypothetical protein KGJ86_18435, partial [Chloroflexota bacterium]|nr:hypothetical protein [Chloroflexota bacterium]